MWKHQFLIFRIILHGYVGYWIFNVAKFANICEFGVLLITVKFVNWKEFHFSKFKPESDKNGLLLRHSLNNTLSPFWKSNHSTFFPTLQFCSKNRKTQISSDFPTKTEQYCSNCTRFHLNLQKFDESNENIFHFL